MAEAYHIPVLLKEVIEGLNPGDKVITSSQRMGTLLNDLLNYSALSDTSVSFVRVDLNEIINNILDDVEVALEEKNAVVKVAELPVINGIPFQLNQLFYNLLNNAIKFTAPGKQPLIEIRCSELNLNELSRFPSLTDNNYYKIEVMDNGIGFDQEYAEKIFVVFQRLHPRHEYSGNGIGLSICKKIVEHHGGIIYAAGVPGKGASFTIILPE